MKSPAARKEELLVACDIQRELLQLELEMLRVHLGKVQSQYRKIPQLWRWIAPALGFWMARRFRRSADQGNRRGRRLFILYKLWRLWRLWR